MDMMNMKTNQENMMANQEAWCQFDPIYILIILFLFHIYLFDWAWQLIKRKSVSNIMISRLMHHPNSTHDKND